MKKVALLVVGLVLCSVPLFAGEYLMNDTGAPVYGLRVVFSEPVELAGFGDILMAVEPAGEATAFTFSGGALDAWDGHWFNWEPASATMLTYEWYISPTTAEIPEGGLTREDLLNLGRPPTYEEIMSVIAEYPGPDEPLYESSPDEVIWLTDFEGHADIYDNDSIKISYADSFDQSQITKIEVYRNGVKMRFLPDLFDVLTNEQMKTFDGNPLEQTPQSFHADHAIFGYRYEFRSLDASNSPVHHSWVTVATPFRVEGHRFIYIGHNFHQRMDASDEELLEVLEFLKAMGFTGVQLGTYQFIDSISSNTTFPQYTEDQSVGWYTTSSDDALHRMLQLIKKAGMESELRVELWITAEWRDAHDGEDRSSIAPSDVHVWFSNYSDLIERYAGIAEQEEVDILCIGVELNSMEQYVGEWKELARETRERFSGDLTFAECTVVDLQWGSWPEDAGAFWEEYDVIEMNCWSPPISDSRDQRFSEMVVRFVDFWEPAVVFYREQYPALPIHFGEIGLWQHDGSSMGYDPTSTVSDYQEFADVWSAYLIGAAYHDLEGIGIWDYSLIGAPTGLNRVDLHGSSALNCIVGAFGGELPVIEILNMADHDAIPDWETIPWIESYSESVVPSKRWTSLGQRPVREGKHWGLPGSDVKGVKLFSTADGTYIYWETYGDDLGESYSYQIHLRPPDRHETLVDITFVPSSGLAQFHQNVDAAYYGLSARIALIEVTERFFVAFIPSFDLPSGDPSTDLAFWNPVSLLIYGLGTDDEERYELPHTNYLR